MSHSAPRSLVGPIPEPADLFGRENLIGKFWHLITSANILLLAPRRFGKSGIMNHVLKCAEDGYCPIYFDVEEFATPRQFFERLIDKTVENGRLRSLIWKGKKTGAKIKDLLRETVEEASVEGTGIKFRDGEDDKWRRKADILLTEIEKSDQKVIFILDELPTMLLRFQDTEGGSEMVKDFLRWFRAARLNPNEDLRTFRFVVGGSNGIDVFLENAKLNAEINDFTRLYVDELDEESASKLVLALAKTLKVEFEESCSPEVIFSILGSRVPYFIQMLMQQLALESFNLTELLSKDRVEEVYKAQVLGATCKSYFNHFRSRLDRYDKTSRRCALNILSCAANCGPASVADSALFEVYQTAANGEDGFGQQRYREILADLECDWYLTRDDDESSYSFKVGVMRDWWKRWYPPVR